MVVCVGNHPEGNAGWALVTSPSEGKEAVDRKAIVLQPGQEEFIRRLYEVNPNTIVVLIANFPYAMPWAAANASTILHMTHASQEQGNALADVLFGDYNPGGKLTQTWPRSLDQLPADDGLRHPSRPDLHVLPGRAAVPVRLRAQLHDVRVLEPRGVAARRSRCRTTVTVSVDVANTGTRDGDEVVQVYARFIGSPVERPAKKLVGFARVTIPAGQTRRVDIPVRGADLAYWDVGRHAWALERARVELMVGNSSADAALTLRCAISVGP